MTNYKRPKVEVYWNLHKKCWSVRDTSTGRVISHPVTVWLAHVDWVVRPAGRAKVLRERKKNVHAFARGEYVDGSTYFPWKPVFKVGRTVAAYYNPYKYDTFVQEYNGDEGVEFIPLRKSSNALLTTNSDGKPEVWAHFL